VVFKYFNLNIFKSPCNSPAQKPDNPQKEDGSDHRRYQITYDPYGRDAKQSEKPTAKHTADYANYQIHDNSKTATSHKLAGNKTGHNSNDYIPQKVHS